MSRLQRRFQKYIAAATDSWKVHPAGVLISILRLAVVDYLPTVTSEIDPSQCSKQSLENRQTVHARLSAYQGTDRLEWEHPT